MGKNNSNIACFFFLRLSDENLCLNVSINGGRPAFTFTALFLPVQGKKSFKHLHRLHSDGAGREKKNWDLLIYL